MIKNIFTNGGIDTIELKFNEFIDNSNSDTNFLIDLNKNSIDIEKLSKSIQIYQDKKNDETDVTDELDFIIDGCKGLFSENITYFFIQVETKQKYFKDFSGENEKEQQLKNKLIEILNSPKENKLKAKITYKKKFKKNANGREIIDIDIII